MKNSENQKGEEYCVNGEVVVQMSPSPSSKLAPCSLLWRTSHPDQE